MRRVRAAWRLRAAERGQLLPLVTALGAALVLTAAAWVLGAEGRGLAVTAGCSTLAALAMWLWGLWDEGGRLLTVREYRSRS